MSIARAFFFERYNENHDPDNGQFASGGGGSGGGGGDSLYKDVGAKNGSGSGSKAASGKDGGSKGPAVSGATAQGQSRPYEGKSPRNDQGHGRLEGAAIKRVFAPSAEHEQSQRDGGATPLSFNELGQGGAAVFHKLIGDAKTANKYGAAVTQYPESDYEHVRLFSTDDGKVGFALKGDDIVSVFKHPDSNAKDIVASILPLAVQEGGRRLDCFDTVLPYLYAKEGFKAVSRTPFDDNYQPDGWDKQTFSDYNGGKPDVVFMVYDKNAAPYQKSDGKTFPSYDDATKAQKNAVAAAEPKASELFDKYHDTSAKADDIVASVSGASEAVASAESRLKDATPTNAPVSKGGFIQADGTYTPERQELHDRILGELFSTDAVKAATPGAGEKPIMTVLGGRGGSGKSWFTKQGIADASRAIYINADDLQAKLPGYEGWNAALYHDEASDLAKAADDWARELGVSVIHDATMRTPGGTAKRVGDYKAAGYAVHGHYMFLPPQTSTKRAVERFVRGGTEGRYVPASYLLNSTTNERTFDGLKGQFDKWTIYENTGASPKLVAEGGASEQQEKRNSRHSTRQVRERSRSAGRRRQPLFAGDAEEAARDARAPQEGAEQGIRALSGAFFFERYNENHDPDSGQFASGSGGGSGGGSVEPAATPAASAPAAKSSKTATSIAATAKPATTGASASEKGAKVKAKLDDFSKAKVELGRFAADKQLADRFIDQWDSRIGEDPAAFKKEFLGGADATMHINMPNSTGEWEISGSLLSRDGRTIGTYTRRIDWRDKTAESAFLQLSPSQTDKAIGKKVLAGNVEMYKKLGIEKVKVHANIDVGGYAWAKYGYVPDRNSWNSLSSKILSKLDRGSSGGGSGSGYRPESWDEIPDHQQDEIRDAWMRSTRDDFVQSEIDNWRDNGDALDQAKGDLAEQFDVDDLRPEWAVDAVNDVIADRADGEHPVPYTQQQVLAAVSVNYETGYEGRPDPKIEFDNDKLREPSTFSKEQLLLPGIEQVDPSSALSVEMRDEIEKALIDAFNEKAEKNSQELDPPDYIYESVEEYQRDSWDNMSDREKYRWADNNGSIEEIETDDEDQADLDIDPDDADGLRELAESSDPKALWAIADSDKGKELLLGSDWYGTLNLKDKETMDRFYAYVGKPKGSTDAQA